MKMVITGHTYGVGKALYDSFKSAEWEVVGLSRSNGYDIDADFNKVVEAATGADLFINNAYRDSQQLKLVEALKTKVSRMIVMGSISRHYPEIIPTQYVHDKQALAEACRLISLNPDGIPVLHLDLGFIQGTEIKSKNPTAFLSDWGTSYNEIVSAVDFWMNNPNVRQLEFRWKLTPHVMAEFERINPDLDPSRIQF